MILTAKQKEVMFHKNFYDKDCLCFHLWGGGGGTGVLSSAEAQRVFLLERIC